MLPHCGTDYDFYAPQTCLAISTIHKIRRCEEGDQWSDDQPENPQLPACQAELDRPDTSARSASKSTKVQQHRETRHGESFLASCIPLLLIIHRFAHQLRVVLDSSPWMTQLYVTGTPRVACHHCTSHHGTGPSWYVWLSIHGPCLRLAAFSMPECYPELTVLTPSAWLSVSLTGGCGRSL
jgi:hypothetical protein